MARDGSGAWWAASSRRLTPDSTTSAASCVRFSDRCREGLGDSVNGPLSCSSRRVEVGGTFWSFGSDASSERELCFSDHLFNDEATCFSRGLISGETGERGEESSVGDAEADLVWSSTTESLILGSGGATFRNVWRFSAGSEFEGASKGVPENPVTGGRGKWVGGVGNDANDANVVSGRGRSLVCSASFDRDCKSGEEYCGGGGVNVLIFAATPSCDRSICSLSEGPRDEYSGAGFSEKGAKSLASFSEVTVRASGIRRMFSQIHPG